jgi:hypothetical protein
LSVDSGEAPTVAVRWPASALLVWSHTVELHELPFSLPEEERLQVAARTAPAVLAVTDRRMIVGSEHRVALDLPIEALRRIQFDVERGRPATLVLVPHDPRHEPQVLAVPDGELEAVSRAMFLVGSRLQELDR